MPIVSFVDFLEHIAKLGYTHKGVKNSSLFDFLMIRSLGEVFSQSYGRDQVREPFRSFFESLNSKIKRIMYL